MADPPNAEARCLVMSQVTGEELLRARVPIALDTAMASLRALSDRLIEETGGRRLRAPAAGWVAVWDGTPAAIQYCMQLQRELLRIKWPPSLLMRDEAKEERDDAGAAVFRGLRVRQGVHRGRLELRRDSRGEEIAGGPALIQVARITHASHGGQVVLSEQAWRHMRGALGGSTVLRDLGPHRFHGVHGSSRLYQVLPGGLDGRRFPPPQTRDVLRTDILARRRPFIGRAGDLAALAELGGFGVRVVSVVGPAGVGKSRLIRQFTLLHGERFRAEGAGGVWLARVDEDRGVDLIRAVGHAMQVPLVLGRSSVDQVTQLGHALDARGEVLLVIDGLYARAQEVAEVLAQWVQLAPKARFLVATPERLGVQGELAYDLGPIRSTELGTARSADAVRLYLARAADVRPGLPLPDPARVQQLVEHLGRNPSVVEFAAGQVDRLGPEAIIRQVSAEDPLQGMITALWEALTEAEREVLQICAVPPRSFDRLFVDGVRGASPGGPDDTQELLSALVARGLLREASHPGAPLVERLSVPRVLRVRVLDTLEPSKREDLQRRFADWMLALCGPWGELAWTPEGPETVARITLEWPQLMDVARWGLSPDRSDAADLDRALRVLPILEPVFASHGPTTLFEELLDQALSRCDEVLGADPILQVRALASRGEVRWRSGRLRLAEGDLLRGLAIAERWGDLEGQGMCVQSLGLVDRARGRMQEGLERLEVARDAFARSGAPRPEAVALARMGVMLLEMGRLADADGCLQAAIEQLRALGARQLEAKFLGSLGLVFQQMGRADRARAIYREAIRIHRITGDARLEGVTLLNLGVLDYHLGRMNAAEEAYRAGHGLAARVGDRLTEAACLTNLGLIRVNQEQMEAGREHLLQALALYRDSGAKREEGVVLGYLGVTEHLEGALDEARAHYQQAIAAMDGGARRFELLFTGWLAAVEAESGREQQSQTAAQLLDAIHGEVPGLGDRDLARVVEVFRLFRARCVGEATSDEALRALRVGAEGDARLALLCLDRRFAAASAEG